MIVSTSKNYSVDQVRKNLCKICDRAWHIAVFPPPSVIIHLILVNSYSSFKAQLKCSFIYKALSDTKTILSGPSSVVLLPIVSASITIRGDVTNIQQ